jgi:hypothetical protein
MSNFDHDYVEFDERGFKCIRCQCCGTTIADWTAITKKLNTDPPQEITAWSFIRLSNYRTVRVALSDGTYADVKLCVACEHEDFDHKKDGKRVAKIVTQWQRAEQLHLEVLGAPKAQIVAAAKKWDSMRAFQRIEKLDDHETQKLCNSIASEVQATELAAQVATPESDTPISGGL